jgi:hypothetical protein
LKRLIPLLSFILLLSSSSAFAQAAPPPSPTTPPNAIQYAGCTLVPVAGATGVFTVDTIFLPAVQQPGRNATGGGTRCAPESWGPALQFLRGLTNPGIGKSEAEEYQRDSDQPAYELVPPRDVITWVSIAAASQCWFRAITVANTGTRPLPRRTVCSGQDPHQCQMA